MMEVGGNTAVATRMWQWSIGIAFIRSANFDSYSSSFLSLLIFSIISRVGFDTASNEWHHESLTMKRAQVPVDAHRWAVSVKSIFELYTKKQ